MIRSRKTSGEQDSESKSRESGESSGGGVRVGGAPKLRMAPVLTTLSQIMVRIAAICKRRLCKAFRSRPFARNLCGYGHAFAEKQLMLGAGKGRSGLVAQVVHAAEELAIHHERKVAAHG